MQVFMKGPGKKSGHDCEASAEGGRISISEGKLRHGTDILPVPGAHYDLVDRGVDVTLFIYLAINGQGEAEVVVDEILEDGVDVPYLSWSEDGLTNMGCIVEAFIPAHVTDVSGATISAHHYKRDRLPWLKEEQDGGSEE